MDNELLLMIPTLLLGLTMIFEINRAWLARNSIERSIENLDDLVERLKEMEYQDILSNKPKFKVGDVVIGNEKAKDYTITKTGFLGIVTAIEDDGLMVIKGLEYPNLSYTVRQECFYLCGFELKSGSGQCPAFGEQQKTEKPKFKVGDVVTVRKEAEKYGITVLQCELIVSEILANGMVKVYVPSSNGEKLGEIVYNPEWLEPVERQTPDISETEKSKTIMEQWATESSTFSRNLMNLLKEFGFSSTYQVKYQILGTFSEGYLKMFPKLKTNTYGADEISVVKLAKALLVASAYLETDNLEEIIDWADKN